MKKILIICLFFCSLLASADQWWGEKETNSLMVAYQLLDDQWIQDVGALTSDWSRIYYTSLKSTRPPGYGVFVPDVNTYGNTLTYMEMSQKDLWDYMYNNPASNGNNIFRDRIENDNDGLGDYITAAALLPAIGWGTQFYDNGNLVTTINDVSLMSVGHRLASLSTMQTIRELQIMSNAVCNCDWEIVSNIYTVVNSALYSSWQGQNWSVSDWTRFIWNYLTTNNSGKPIKESLNDISSYLSSNSDNLSNIWSWIEENQEFFTNRTNNVDYSSILNRLGGYSNLGLNNTNSWNRIIGGYINSLSDYWLSAGYDVDTFIEDYLTDYGLSDTIDYMARNIPMDLYSSRFQNYADLEAYTSYLTSFSSLFNYMNTGTMFVKWWPTFTDISTNTIPLRFAWENLTNKTTSVAYTLVEPSVGRDIYGTLTNAYITSGSMNSSDWNWFDRVEMLLAALVFPETTSSNGVADADSAQSSAESQSDQFKDVLTSIQSTAFGSAKQQTQTTANTFTGFFTTLNSSLTLNPPEALIIPVPNTPSDLDQSSGDLAWTVDFSSGGSKVVLEFCRALSSFIVIVGFLFVVWKICLLTFRVTLTISSLCFKTVQRILGK